MVNTAAKAFHHVNDTERRLVLNMHKEGVSWDMMLKITQRSTDTIHKIVTTGKGV